MWNLTGPIGKALDAKQDVKITIKKKIKKKKKVKPELPNVPKGNQTQFIYDSRYKGELEG